MWSFRALSTVIVILAEWYLRCYPEECWQAAGPFDGTMYILNWHNSQCHHSIGETKASADLTLLVSLWFVENKFIPKQVQTFVTLWMGWESLRINLKKNHSSAASDLFRSILEMQILGPLPNNADSECVDVDIKTQYFSKLSRNAYAY